MTSRIRFVSVPTAESPGTLLTLNFDDRRYLFGQVSEGTQRRCLQHGLNLVRTKHVFLTGPIGWHNTGGLTGLALTLADTLTTHANALAAAAAAAAKSGKKKTAEEVKGLTVHGGAGLLHSVASGRRYIFRHGGHVKFREFKTSTDKSPDYEDEHIRVWTIKTTSSSHVPVPESASDTDKAAAKHQVACIVSDMWETTGRRDTLEEMELQHVRRPVKYIWTRDPETKDLQLYNGPLPDGPSSVPNPTLKVLVHKPWPGPASSASLPRHQADSASMSYLIKTWPRRGKLRVDLAKSHGITEGRDFGMLTTGKSVTNSKGQVITPHMVLEPETPGQAVLVLDIPSSSYLDNLLAQLAEHDDGTTLAKVDIIFWIIAPDVVQDARLAQFVKDMPHIKHIFSSEVLSMDSTTLQTTVKHASLLRSVLPQISDLVSRDTPAQKLDLTGTGNEVDIRTASDSLEVQLRPEFKIQTLTREPKSELEISQSLPALLKLAQDLNEQHAEAFDKWRATLALPDAEVVFLGTGSAIPALTRNVTGILLRVPGHGNYILDCGEDTTGQLRRMYTAEQYREIMRDLRMVYISHLHADHHLGTIGLLKSWYEINHDSKPLAQPASGHEPLNMLTNGLSQRLIILAKHNFHQMIADFSQLEDIGYSRVVPIVPVEASVDLETATIKRNTALELFSFGSANRTVDTYLHEKLFGPVDIATVRVKHCAESCGLALTFHPPLSDTTSSQAQSKPFRVAWSGDCRPSRALAVIGRDADLLIHESTFGAGFEGQARAKAHSTMAEARTVAEAMRAKALVLTHFSQRYSKLPDMPGLLAPSAQTQTQSSNEDIAQAAWERLRLTDLDERAMPFDHEQDDMAGDLGADGADSAEQDAGAAMTEPLPTTAAAAAAFVPAALPTCAAFDFMRIRIGNIPLMQAYGPALVELFRAPSPANTEPNLPFNTKDDAGRDSDGAATGPHGRESNAPGKQKRKNGTAQSPPARNDGDGDVDAMLAAAERNSGRKTEMSKRQAGVSWTRDQEARGPPVQAGRKRQRVSWDAVES